MKKGKEESLNRVDKVAGARKRIKCWYCWKEFSQNTRHRHEKMCRQSPDVIERDSQMFRCQYCEFVSTQQDNRNSHIKVCPQDPDMIERESEMFR